MLPEAWEALVTEWRERYRLGPSPDTVVIVEKFNEKAATYPREGAYARDGDSLTHRDKKCEAILRVYISDHHTWVRPAPTPCLDCPCCTAALCKLAKEKNGACHWYAGSSDFDLSQCPCW